MDMESVPAPTVADPLTLRQLCDAFLAARGLKVSMGQLSPHTLTGYADTCRWLVKTLGSNRPANSVGPEEFQELLRSLIGRGPVRIANQVRGAKIVFRWAFNSGKLEREPRYGPDFREPSKKDIRIAKAQKGPRLYTADEVRRLLDAAGVALRAMILLGINAGLGNADCGRLPISAVDLKTGWLDYLREKTGTDRRCPLWAETIDAIRKWMFWRPEPATRKNENIVFLTRLGRAWFGDTTQKPICVSFQKIARLAGVGGSRGFYGLRHTFQTIGDESGDFVAVRTIMGHTMTTDIASHYREQISNARLVNVTESVRAWLFADTGWKPAPEPELKEWKFPGEPGVKRRRLGAIVTVG